MSQSDNFVIENEEEVSLIVEEDNFNTNNNSEKKRNFSKVNKKRIKKNVLTLTFLIIGILSLFVIYRNINGFENPINVIKAPDNIVAAKNNTSMGILEGIPNGFELLDINDPTGPITVNITMDDGTKLNYFDYIIPEKNTNYYYNKEQFNELSEIKYKGKEEYFCEYITAFPPEYYKGYSISCPRHYTIAIDKVFYGRHAHDKENCIIDYKGDPVGDANLNVTEECGYKPVDMVKELCEGKSSCTVRPGGSHFEDKCMGFYKYLHVGYHCVKNKKMKKEKILIVMYYNKIKPNTAAENAVSAFYQYSKIHGYDFQFNSYRYDTERQIFYMKLNSVLENIYIGLKEKKYDWIFWVDCDVILANPNLKLETFLPSDKMSNTHLIFADDVNGMNAGVFLIRVHPWSLNVLMRAMSYSYFNNKQGLKYADQSSLNNVLVSGEESDHYVVVPQNWFNSYIGLNKDGDFLLHQAGHVNKDDEAKTFREHIRSDKKWYSKTNKEMREEVLKYYNLPKERQHHIKME